MSSSDAPESLPLLESPADGVPDVIDTPRALQRAAEALAAGTGSVAVDAERASGFRYGQRAFLVQLRREGVGTLLIDPEPFDDLLPLNSSLRGSEWVLHAATQDLPCLADLDMTPDALFDTELAARFLGFDRFGLAAVVGETVGVRLAKEHSAVDWSTRPLPESWLTYAALDVEVLLDVADRLDEQLHARGLAEFAQQEFEHLLAFAPVVHEEPWRRMHGLGTLRNPRQLARAREVWETRDRVAREADTAPSRILKDRDIVALAQHRVRTADDVFRALGTGRLTRRHAQRWAEALQRADSLQDGDLPRRTRSAPTGPKLDRALVKERTQVLKQAMYDLSETTRIPHDLLLQPALVRAAAALQDPDDEDLLEEYLRDQGAREWQRELSVPVLVRAARAMEA